ncbi:hypothetical protein AAK967_04330 [Atopobiaceae bacterium 24-176]
MNKRHESGSARGGRAEGWRKAGPVVAVAIVAALIAVACNINVFAPLAMLGDEGAQPAPASDDAVPEPSQSLVPMTVSGVSVEVPDNWVEVEVAGLHGASPTAAGAHARVTVDASQTSAMSGVSSVSSADDMEALARTVSAAQGGSANVDVSPVQGKDGLWRATLEAKEGSLGGTELLIGDGQTVYVVEGLWSPDASPAVVAAVRAAVASATVVS